VPRGRLWLNDGSCIRLRPERRNHLWSYDFVEAQTHDGRKLRLLTLIDESTRECLAAPRTVEESFHSSSRAFPLKKPARISIPVVWRFSVDISARNVLCERSEQMARRGQAAA
jgi:hypothetical protein